MLLRGMCFGAAPCGYKGEAWQTTQYSARIVFQIAMDAANVVSSMLPVRVGLDRAHVTLLFRILETNVAEGFVPRQQQYTGGPTFVLNIVGCSRKRTFQVIDHQMSKVFDRAAVHLGSYT